MAKTDFNYDATETLTKAQKWLIARGRELEGMVKRSMRKGTGRIYMKGKKRNIVHIASAPGQAPAVDTGRLHASISTNFIGSGSKNGPVGSKALAEDGVGEPANDSYAFKVVVGTRVDYAPGLEFGTRSIAPRPFMRPAFEEMKSRMSK